MSLEISQPKIKSKKSVQHLGVATNDNICWTLHYMYIYVLYVNVCIIAIHSRMDLEPCRIIIFIYVTYLYMNTSFSRKNGTILIYNTNIWLFIYCVYIFNFFLTNQFLLPSFFCSDNDVPNILLWWRQVLWLVLFGVWFWWRQEEI